MQYRCKKLKLWCLWYFIVVGCDVVGCDVVWCDVVWCDVVWCDVV